MLALVPDAPVHAVVAHDSELQIIQQSRSLCKLAALSGCFHTSIGCQRAKTVESVRLLEAGMCSEKDTSQMLKRASALGVVIYFTIALYTLNTVQIVCSNQVRGGGVKTGDALQLIVVQYHHLRIGNNGTDKVHNDT